MEMELLHWRDDPARSITMEFWGCWETGQCLIRVLREDPKTGASRTLKMVKNPDALTAYALAQEYDLDADEWFQLVNNWLSEAPPVLH